MARPMLYGILRATRRPAPLLEFGLRGIKAGGLIALVADQEAARISGADTEMLRGYADRIARIHREETLIPMRFGCLLASDHEVRELLKRRRERLCALLEHVDGCVEFGIRLLNDAADAPSYKAPLGLGTEIGERPGLDRTSGQGRAYLGRIRERLLQESRMAQGARQARERIEREVAGLFRDLHEEHARAGRHELVSLAFLTPRQTSAAFLDRLRQISPDIPGSGLVTGPWPPYSFVGAIDDDLPA